MEGEKPPTVTELDTHADTCCVGINARILMDTGRKINVFPFLDELGSISEVPIVQAAIAIDSLNGLSTVILIFNQCLYFPKMEYNLLCPNQLRMNGVHIYDTPRQFDKRPHALSHTIFFADENFALPLEMNGVVSYFKSRRPSEDEVR